MRRSFAAPHSIVSQTCGCGLRFRRSQTASGLACGAPQNATAIWRTITCGALDAGRLAPHAVWLRCNRKPQPHVWDTIKCGPQKCPAFLLKPDGKYYPNVWIFLCGLSRIATACLRHNKILLCPRYRKMRSGSYFWAESHPQTAEFFLLWRNHAVAICDCDSLNPNRRRKSQPHFIVPLA